MAATHRTEPTAGEHTADSTSTANRSGRAMRSPAGRSGGSRRRVLIAVAAVVGFALAGFGGAMLALAVLLTLILLHEGGHYLAARACKLRVHQFFVGFGPVVWSTDRNGTEYGVKAIPLGGFVRIAGMSDEDRDDPQGYGQAGRLQQMAVVAAGPVANLVTALVVGFTVLFVVGVTTVSTALGVVDPAGPAHDAGIRVGDRIVAVDERPIESFDQVVAAVGTAGTGSSLTIDVERDGSVRSFTVPVVAAEDGRARIGIGAGQERTTEGFVDSLTGSVDVVRRVSADALRGLGALVTGFGETLSGLTGAEVDPENRPLSPVGAIQVGTSVGGDSVENALTLVVVYSVFLAVFNLLPIPPLDGGHMAVAAIEGTLSAIRRRRVRVSQAIVQRIAVAFVASLLFVGVVALVLDLTQPIQL